MQFIILTLFCVIVATVCLPSSATQPKASVQLISKEELAQIQKKNPNVVLTPLERETNFTYTIGNRVSGDRVNTISYGNVYYGYPTDSRLTANPSSSTGYVFTYVIFHVQQSSTYGQGYVIAGGIGQNHITIYIDAFETTFMHHWMEAYEI